MRRWWLGALVASLAVAGCTSPGEDGEDAGEQKLTAYDKRILRAADAEASAPAEPVDSAMNGGAITVLSSRSGPDSLRESASGHARAIRSLVTRGLTQYQLRDGEPVLVPDLATDLGTANKKQTRWEFTIRNGAVWEDGDPITSQDLARGIEAALDSPAGDRYFGGESDGQADESSESEKSDDSNAVVQTPDERTVVVRTDRPFGDLPHFVASPNIAAIPPDDKPATLASGPYAVEQLSAESAVLLRNDAWDPASDPVRQQYPDKWSFDFNRKSDQIRQRVIEDGERGQVTIVPDDLDPKQDKDLIDKAGDRALTGSGRCVEVTHLNAESLSDQVRKAVVAATPRKAGSLLPKWTPGRLDSAAEPAGDPTTSRKTLEKADALGTELTLYAVDDDEGEAAHKEAAQAYEKAGFTVETETIGRSDLEAIADGSEQPSEDVSLWPGELCTSWPSGGGLFPLEAEDGPAFSELSGLQKQFGQIESKKRDAALAAWGKLDRRLVDNEAIVVPIRGIPNTALAGSRIAHLQLHPVTGEPDYASAFLGE